MTLDTGMKLRLLLPQRRLLGEGAGGGCGGGWYDGSEDVKVGTHKLLQFQQGRALRTVLLTLPCTHARTHGQMDRQTDRHKHNTDDVNISCTTHEPRSAFSAGRGERTPPGTGTCNDWREVA